MLIDLEHFELEWRCQRRAKALTRRHNERKYLSSLMFSTSQLKNYDDRVTGIARRLAEYLERRP